MVKPRQTQWEREPTSIPAACGCLHGQGFDLGSLPLTTGSLREHQVNTIALESTGIYWIPLYELLQAEGFEVLLVDPSYSHQLRGRPKTDRRDCQ